MQSQKISKHPEYKSSSNGVEVTVKSFYAEELSLPVFHKYVFIYKVKIRNNSKSKIQIIGRKWEVVDEDGTCHHIEGEGIIGKQPIILPFEEFEYASQAILRGKTGIMFGSYNGINLENNNAVEINIPAFSLDAESFFEKEKLVN